MPPGIVTAEWAMERDGLGCRKVHERRKEGEGGRGYGWMVESAKANMTTSIDGSERRATRESAKNCIAAERERRTDLSRERRESE